MSTNITDVKLFPFLAPMKIEFIIIYFLLFQDFLTMLANSMCSHSLETGHYDSVCLFKQS